jgi:hypothetical protein
MTEKHESEKKEATQIGEMITEQKTIEAAAAPAIVEGEFKVTVRKLEMPVRARGVLAE